jgi:acyl-coenzyme A thioesterase PaaI-like protein
MQQDSSAIIAAHDACDNSPQPNHTPRDRIWKMTPAQAESIRHRALVALSNNRTPGYNFPGYFLDLQCTRYDTGGVVLEMDTGAHNANADGTTHLAAITCLADFALAQACRTFVDPSIRTATMTLHLRFLGGEARGRLRAEAHSTGFSERTALAEADCFGRLISQGKEILRMSGTWGAPPAPEGRAMHPLPWARTEPAPPAPMLKPAELDPMERAAMRRVVESLRNAKEGEFANRLWTPVVRNSGERALGRLPIGLHVGNRVGHVQGGFSISTALFTAIAAVPQHPLITAASAWYISPGQGKSLSARSSVLQRGRNVAVVRTELLATGGKRVLEVISNHAVARKPS